jgi:thiamine-phosphate diphosphorylase
MSRADLCSQLRLYVVIDPAFCRLDPVETCRAVLAGGATAIQLRVKRMTDREALGFADRMRPLAAGSDALFIVNDRLDLALACGAGGAHLGVDDLPVASARSIALDDFVIGFSPENDEQSRTATQQGASYLGIGPVFGTTSKGDAGPPVGLETLARRSRVSGLPVVGIGGVNEFNASEVLDAGACGVAVMSAITEATSPERATRAIAKELASSSQALQ